MMNRREFITLLGGTVAAWPLAARSQQDDRVRRIGFLSVITEGDPEGQTWIREFLQRLQELGWTNGRNVQVDFRYGGAEGGLSAHDRGCRAIIRSTVDAGQRARCCGNQTTHHCICTRDEWRDCRVSKPCGVPASRIDHCRGCRTTAAG